MLFSARFSLLHTLVVLLLVVNGTRAVNPRIQDRKARMLVGRQGGRGATGGDGTITLPDGTVMDGPTTLRTVTTTETEAGTRVETCIVTLTPVTVDGETLVRQEKSCSIEFTPKVGDNESATTTVATTTSSTASASTTSSSSSSSTVAASSAAEIGILPVTSSTAASSSSVSTSSSATATPAPTTGPIGGIQVPVQQTVSDVFGGLISPGVEPTTQTGAATSSAPASTSTQNAIIVIGTSSVVRTSAVSSPAASPSSSVLASSAIPSSSASSTTSGPQPTIGNGANAGVNPVGSVSSSSSSSVASSSPVSATIAAASASPESVQLPGTKLSVLPIGLGIFGGITVIALLVVGYVLWERTKYRRNFRERLKLSDQAATMGYGGMAQRV